MLHRDEMARLYRFATVVMLFIWSIAASAQHKCSVIGTVVDADGQFIPYASVVLYDDDKILTGGVTDDNGRFRLVIGSLSGELELSIEFIGYMKKRTRFTPSGMSVNLGEIVLEEDADILSEAVVTGKVEAQKTSLERTSINASSNMVSSKGSAIDVLSSASSVTISNDVISIRGNSNILVLMDGILPADQGS